MFSLSTAVDIKIINVDIDKHLSALISLKYTNVVCLDVQHLITLTISTLHYIPTLLASFRTNDKQVEGLMRAIELGELDTANSLLKSLARINISEPEVRFFTFTISNRNKKQLI